MQNTLIKRDNDRKPTLPVANLKFYVAITTKSSLHTAGIRSHITVARPGCTIVLEIEYLSLESLLDGFPPK